MQPPAATPTTCLDCGRSDMGDGRFCRWCGQFLLAPRGVRAASVARRLAAVVLDTILVPLTLFIGYSASMRVILTSSLDNILVPLTPFIGYLIWWLIVLERGQTPGKQLLGIRAMKDNGQPSRWGRTFLREFVAKGIIFGLLAAITASVVWWLDNLWPLWDRDRQALHDKVAGTVVVRGP